MLRAGPRIALTHLGMMRWTGLVLPAGREDCTIVSHSLVLSTMGKSRMISAQAPKKKAFGDAVENTVVKVFMKVEELGSSNTIPLQHSKIEKEVRLT